MSTTRSIAKIAEVIATWLDPDRREKVVLRECIEAAEQLLMILRKQGVYATLPEKRVKELEIHYQKRFDAWKDGNG